MAGNAEAMIAITTKSSMRVKPRWSLDRAIEFPLSVDVVPIPSKAGTNGTPTRRIQRIYDFSKTNVNPSQGGLLSRNPVSVR